MASVADAVKVDKVAALRQIETKLSQALTADETGRIGDALTKYIEIETEARQLAASLSPSDGKIKERLNAYLANIMARKEILSESVCAVLPAVPSAPPSYSEVAPPRPPPPPPRSLSRPPPPECSSLLLSLPRVQLYAVSQEGQVSAPSTPNTLAVRQLENGAPFIQVGDWTCPLIPGESPALITGEGRNTLMVPDPTSVRENDSVAVILPAGLPPGQREAFLRLMSQLTKLMISDGGSVREVLESDLRVLERRHSDQDWTMNGHTNGGKDDEEMQKRRTSDLVANGIQTTSELLARGLKWSAEKGSNLIQYGSERWRSRIEDSQTNGAEREQRPVDPRVSQGARVARTGTHTVVNTSTKAVGVMGSAAKSLAVWAAPYLQRGAQQVLPSSWTNNDSSGRSKAQSALTVASAAISGFGTVYEALEHSAKLVGRSVADGTSGVVQARYGDEAGQVTSNVLYSVGNVGLTVHNVQNLGPKAVVKTVASHGAAACSEEQKKSQQKRNQNPQ